MSVTCPPGKTSHESSSHVIRRHNRGCVEQSFFDYLSHLPTVYYLRGWGVGGRRRNSLGSGIAPTCRGDGFHVSTILQTQRSSGSETFPRSFATKDFGSMVVSACTHSAPREVHMYAATCLSAALFISVAWQRPNLGGLVSPSQQRGSKERRGRGRGFCCRLSSDYLGWEFAEWTQTYIDGVFTWARGKRASGCSD